jgi:shikimate 5-dehydrogenase
MLMHQGALAFDILFGVRPAVSAALRSHLELALRDGA